MLMFKNKSIFIQQINKIIRYITFALNRLVPKSLFLRIIIITAATILIIQTIFVIIVYDSQWRIIRNSLSRNIATNIGNVTYILNSTEQKIAVKNSLSNSLLASTNPQIIKELPNEDSFSDTDIELNKTNTYFYNYLKLIVPNPIHILQYDAFNKSILQIAIRLDDGTFLTFSIAEQLFFTSALNHLIILIIGLYCVIILVILQFFRLQIRPLKNLARAAKRFGKGEKVGYLTPTGAGEIYAATVAFNKMKDQIEDFVEQRILMLSSISHDLKSSLTRMQLSLTLLDIDNKKDLQEELIIMESMLVSYLTFSQDTQMTKKRELIDPQQLIENTITNYQSSQLTIKTNYLQKPPKLLLNKIDIVRVIENILTNASRCATQVNITLRSVKNSIEIIIEDNGIGINPDYHKQVFKPFYKLNEARTPEKDSVGLGLYIVKNIVSSHGGTIILNKSDTLGGLRVEITLPI